MFSGVAYITAQCGSGHIYWKNHSWKTSLFVQRRTTVNGNLRIVHSFEYSLQANFQNDHKIPIQYHQLCLL